MITNIADILAAQAGDREAANRAVRANINLVHYAMRSRLRKGHIHDYPEAFSEGMACLHRCVLGFDPGMGFAFSTYATRSIFRAIQGSQRRGKLPLVYDDTFGAAASDEHKEYSGIEPAEAWQEAKAALTPRDFDIVARRMKGETLEEVGTRIGRTKEAVRLAQKNALVKLRGRLLRKLEKI